MVFGSESYRKTWFHGLNSIQNTGIGNKTLSETVYREYIIGWTDDSNPRRIQINTTFQLNRHPLWIPEQFTEGYEEPDTEHTAASRTRPQRYPYKQPIQYLRYAENISDPYCRNGKMS